MTITILMMDATHGRGALCAMAFGVRCWWRESMRIEANDPKAPDAGCLERDAQDAPMHICILQTKLILELIHDIYEILSALKLRNLFFL
jgi:hypothetical protein